MCSATTQTNCSRESKTASSDIAFSPRTVASCHYSIRLQIPSAGAQADVVTDLVTYSHAKGIYGGINLDGTVVAISDEWNEAYYGKKGIHAPDILVRGAVHAKGADRLASDVARAAGKK